MEYISAIVPPLVMAIGFGFLVRAIIRNQGGAQKSKEDAAADVLVKASAARGSAAE
ncbi:hypothetical protein OG500_17120 [Kitasatospora sp. NBC_01250]|uniref:hypothetical protein n=1 Tax=unclassified Kitasatospora TaxID=2633591 RepID=UPI002E12F81D|nr:MULTISPECIES: hypothetical protein [unclassified Kitasatospora]WSJ67880.1 hypothetical protein OG294_18130 [Kitasatospora sp. NBC_01302]